MVDLKVKLGNWTLKNPIIAASGTFGFGHDHAKFFDINILGAFSCKAITAKKRLGNKLPRIAEGKNGMINSIGLQNEGVDHCIEYEIPSVKKIYQDKFIANIAGTTIEEYVEIVEKLNSCTQIAIYEVNVSCPNVAKGAMKFDSDKVHLSKLIKALKKVTKKPIYIKLSPQVTNIVEIAIAAQQAGADGLVLINTIPSIAIDYKTGKPILENKIGGLSGPAIKPIALRAVYLCSQAVTIPIIGCGGITNEKDVLEFIYAGATCVQIGAQGLVDPCVYPKIICNLPKLMDNLKISNVQSIIGKSWKK